MEPDWILLWEQSQIGSLRRKPSIPWLGVGGLKGSPSVARAWQTDRPCLVATWGELASAGCTYMQLLESY